MSMLDGLQLSEAKPVQAYDETRAAFVARVEEEGHRVVYPKPNQLLVDIDSEDQYATFQRALECFKKNHKGAVAIEEHYSRSGAPKRHITVTLPFKVTPWQRVAWQAAFGSDPMREMLSCFRLVHRDPHPTLFMEASSNG
jgi:hypothetical protein